MNIQRGILRLWLVVSAIWIGGVFLIAMIDGELAQVPEWVIPVALVPPILLRIAIVLLGWIFAGFFAENSN